MLVELMGKAGCLCEPARKGELRCPLIVRPTSEDVVTDHLFRTLRVLNPRWWLPDLLNIALGAPRFRRQVFRQFRVDLWRKQRPYPRQWIPWDEGRTEVDAVISWENPPTTVFIEMKYGSDVSRGTTHNNGETGHGSDQLIRNLRVGLLESGWFEEPALFSRPTRDFVLLLISPKGNHQLIDDYQDEGLLRSAIPHSDRIARLPRMPFIGAASFQQVAGLLRTQRKWYTSSEQLLIGELVDYLNYKRSQRR